MKYKYKNYLPVADKWIKCNEFFDNASHSSLWEYLLHYAKSFINIICMHQCCEWYAQQKDFTQYEGNEHRY